MTREEQVLICRTCTNRKMDPQQGIICSLTGSPATFEEQCPDYSQDTSVKPRTIDEEDPEEIKAQITPAIMDSLLTEQNLSLGIISGIIVGLVGSLLWALITVVTEYQIGYMAVAIGIGVGFAIRTFGKGLTQVFGFWGAGISLISCLLGNVLSIFGFVANYAGVSYLEAFTTMDYAMIPEIMAESFSVMDLLFYGLAIYTGYRFSFRKITNEDIQQLQEVKN
jgi:hypothetical protein